MRGSAGVDQPFPSYSWDAMDEKDMEKQTQKTGGLPTGDNPETTTAMEVEADPAGQTTAPVPKQQLQEGSGSTTNPEGADLQQTASRVNRLHLGAQKLSGAQRRKEAKEAALAAGVPWIPRKPRNKKNKKAAPKSGESEEAAAGPSHPGPTTSGTPSTKRNRSEGSTPSPVIGGAARRPEKKPRQDGPLEAKPGTSTQERAGETFSQALSPMKMAVVLEKYPDERLTEEQSKQVQQAILELVYKSEPGTGPRFKNGYAEKGVVYITCANEAAKLWLRERVPQLRPWEGATLRTGTAKEVVRTAKVVVWMPAEPTGQTEPLKALQMLKAQNTGLNTEEWVIVNSRVEEKGMTLVLNIDENSLKALAEEGYKAYLGFSELNFKVVSQHQKPDDAAGNSNKPAA